MNRKFIVFWGLIVAALVGIFFSTKLVAEMLVAESRDPANYVGVKMCGVCHKKEDGGNQFGKWQESPHAKAYELLGTAAAKEAGQRVGVDNPQTSAKCLKCHSTAYNFTETVATQKITPEDGVTCESCHGPGKNYGKKATMENRQEAIAAGLIYPASKSCNLCHNDQSPTWKADRFTTKDGKKVGFDFEQAYEKIKHSDPKVKN